MLYHRYGLRREIRHGPSAGVKAVWICIHGKKLPNPKHFWIDPLLRIRDAYPKLLIARIYQPAWQHDGIRVINAAEWMADAAPPNKGSQSFGE